ncbi:MAG: SpoIIIAH-like family protein [Oscillospiraceae bacterium]|nr:SpoIIIAH-like family protein [Ruminococcus sp.]MDE6594601.1 SpoIIIAH-like family protein [Oscillospiraceae bacterium]
MRKPNLIIGKKHIILACLTLILGAAIYMNYAFASVDENESIIAAGTREEDTAEAANYGDAAFVSAEGESDYFAQVRIARMTSRDEAVETLSTILGGGDLSGEESATYTNEAMNLSQLSDSENTIESLIKAQGFEDCVVYLNGTTANIVVKSEGLVPSEAAQIKDILLTEVTIPAENIRIFEVK